MLPETYIRFISNQLATAQREDPRILMQDENWNKISIKAYKALQAVTAYAENQPMIYFDRVIELLKADDGSGIRQINAEMTQWEMDYVWKRLHNQHRGAYRRLLSATVQTQSD